MNFVLSLKMNRILIFLSTTLIFFAGCSKKKNINDMMTRMEIRDSIMNNIAASQQWMAEMLMHIKKNEAAAKMTATDTGIIKKMLAEDFPKDTGLNHLMIAKVFKMASNDTDVCDVTCVKFMQNP